MPDEINKFKRFNSIINGFRYDSFKLAFIVLTIINSFGCKHKETPSNLLFEAQFHVDTNLLEKEPLRDSLSNIEIKTPLNWVPLDSGNVQKLETGILVGDYKNARLIKSLINKIDSSMFLILDVVKMDDQIFKGLRKDYAKILNPDLRWSGVQYGEFKLNCFKIEQYVLQNKDMLHFKLIGYEKRDPENKAHFELWYFINPNSYEKDIKFVESSIGSLNCLIFKN